MGRHTGWLAGAASLAAGADCNGPDIILLPERPFDENVFLEKVAQLEKDRHNVIIAASEGVKNKDGVFLCDLVSTAGQLDAFGHKAILSGTSRYLADLIHVRLGCKTRAIEFSTCSAVPPIWQAAPTLPSIPSGRCFGGSCLPRRNR